MSDYRAVLRLANGEDPVRVADQQMRSWLRTKLKGARHGTLETADWDGLGTHDLGSDAILGVARADSTDGGTRRQLLRFTEVNDQGEWTVSLYSIETSSERAIVVTGNGPRWIAPPRVVGQFLEAADVRDAGQRVFNGAHLVDESEMAAVLQYLVDPARQNALILAASPGHGLEQNWRGLIDSLTAQSAGVASVFVVPAHVMEGLNDRLPPSHGIRAGQVRTFLPDVDLESGSDAYRHRILGPATLARSSNSGRVAESLQQTHARSIRKWAIEERLGTDVRRALHQLDKRLADIRRTEILDALTVDDDHSPDEPREGEATSLEQPPSEPRRRDRITRLVKRWLGREHRGDEDLDEVDAMLRRQRKELELLGAQVESTRADLEARDDELSQLRRRFEDSELDAAAEADTARTLERENGILRARLKRAGQYEDLYVEPEADAWAAPESMIELVLRLQVGEQSHVALDRVVFCGDADPAAEIDAYDPLARYAARMWDYVRVLFDYADLKLSGGYRGSVHTYLTDDTHSGARCSPQRHASTESDSVTTNKRLRDQRLFTVPLDVSPDGRAHMFAHFKPTHADTFAPRMHYLDDTAGTGKVYIGYIGRHLGNTKTN